MYTLCTKNKEKDDSRLLLGSNANRKTVEQHLKSTKNK